MVGELIFGPKLSWELGFDTTHHDPQNKAPSSRIRILLKTETFFSVNGVYSITENRGFRKLSPEWRISKTETFRIRVDGRKQRFSNIARAQSCPVFVNDSRILDKLLLLGLLSSLIPCMQLHFTLLHLQAEYLRK